MVDLIYSGVPKAGDPVLMSTFEEKEPYIMGAPGRTNWVRVTNAKTSAFCCTNVPACLIGAMAPDNVNGVMQVTCADLASSMVAYDIGMSSCRGEFVLIIPITDGLTASSSLVHSRAIQCISMQSLVLSLPRGYD